jgi:hypothetical protein
MGGERGYESSRNNNGFSDSKKGKNIRRTQKKRRLRGRERRNIVVN